MLILCAAAVAMASKTLWETLGDVYDEECSVHSELVETVKTFDILWTDLITSLQDSFYTPLHNYVKRFAETKGRYVALSSCTLLHSPARICGVHGSACRARS